MNIGHPLWVSLFYPTDEEIESHRIVDPPCGDKQFIAEDDGNVYRVYDDGTVVLDLSNVVLIGV